MVEVVAVAIASLNFLVTHCHLVLNPINLLLVIHIALAALVDVAAAVVSLPTPVTNPIHHLVNEPSLHQI